MDPLQSLEQFGYAIVPEVLPAAQCEELGRVLDQMEAAKRAAGDVSHFTENQSVMYALDYLRPDVFLPFIDRPELMQVMSPILKDPFLLSSFSASRPGPGGGVYRPHIDGREPLCRFEESTHISAMYCVDEFTADNGALNVWPKSHVSGQRPPAGVQPAELPGRVSCAAPRGSLIFFLGSMWHEVGANTSRRRRWALILTYCRWWVKPTYSYHLCGADVYKRLNARQKVLYGFTSIPPAPQEARHLTLTRVEDLPA